MKRITTTLTAAFMILAALTVPASASEHDSSGNEMNTQVAGASLQLLLPPRDISKPRFIPYDNTAIVTIGVPSMTLPVSPRRVQYQIWLNFPDNRSGLYEPVGGGTVSKRVYGKKLNIRKKICFPPVIGCRSTYRMGVQFVGRIGKVTVHSPIVWSDVFHTT